MLSLSKHKRSRPQAVMAGSSLRLLTARPAEDRLECGVSAISGLLRFESVAEVKEFLKRSLAAYRSEYDWATEVIASMYRSMGERAAQGSANGSWSKVGELLVDASDPDKGRMELTLQLLTDMKPRVSRLVEVLTEFSRLEELPLKPDVSFLLYLRNGVPDRVIVEDGTSKQERFSLTEEYELV